MGDHIDLIHGLYRLDEGKKRCNEGLGVIGAKNDTNCHNGMVLFLGP